MRVDSRPPNGAVALAPQHADLDDPALYLNRELTWLEFNRRVLAEAEDKRNPLLERLKFLAITGSNIDDFVMKRIGGLKQQIGAGLREIDRALAMANRHGASFQLSEILRVKGDLLLALGRPRLGEVKACYREAMEVANKQGAKLSKLRVSLSFARLLAAGGDPEQARAMLRPTLDAIDGGHDLADLKAAEVLLAELGDP